MTEKKQHENVIADGSIFKTLQLNYLQMSTRGHIFSCAYTDHVT